MCDVAEHSVSKESAIGKGERYRSMVISEACVARTGVETWGAQAVSSGLSP